MIKSKKSDEWIVFLHGMGGDYSIFYKQIDEFKDKYNLLFIDFPGHGKSDPLDVAYYTATKVAEEIFIVLDHLHIKQVHLTSFSLGTIIAYEMIALDASRIQSVVLAGAVVKWNWWSDILVRGSYKVRFLAPYMAFYKLFAILMMPKNNHKKSREIFIREASKLGRKEFMKWARLLTNIEQSYRRSIQQENSIPKLYLIGIEDHMFIKSAVEASNNDPFSQLVLLEDCGHVCIIENSVEANQAMLSFFNEQVMQKSASLA